MSTFTKKTIFLFLSLLVVSATFFVAKNNSQKEQNDTIIENKLLTKFVRPDFSPRNKSNFSPQEQTKILENLEALEVSNNGINWFEVGPNDIGGRTRALVVDRNNSNNVVAAGVTGGIWKTTNAGDFWELKSNLTFNFNVTSIVQHPINSNEWYASTGEVFSSSNRPFSHVYGAGVLYKSVDNGDTWTKVGTPQESNNYLYLTSRIVISPTTNTIFVATNGFGIAKSTDGGLTFDLVLGDANGSYDLDPFQGNFVYTDVVVNENGILLAQMSGELSDGAGFYKSIDDGANWTNITPSTFVAIASGADIQRSVFALAPSNPNIAYSFTMGATLYGIDKIHFNKINITGGVFEDRSANLVKWGVVGDSYPLPAPQSGWNMALAVKPNDENFVVIGGASGGPLRSSDAYATDAGTYEYIDWFDSQFNISTSTIHNDQHALVFDPNSPNKLWVGNDGGVYNIEDVTSDNTQNQWVSKNNGFNVTQYYDLAIAPFNQGNKVFGASQDNASPAMIWDENNTSQAFRTLVSGGDGISSYWMNNYIFTTGLGGPSPGIFQTQALGGTQILGNFFAVNEGFLQGAGLRDAIDQYTAINPNNENIIYMSGGLQEIYRGNNAISWLSITNQDIVNDIQTFSIYDINPSFFDYGFLAMSYANDNDILYFSLGSIYENNFNLKPKIYKLLNASTASISDAIEISSPDFPVFGQVCDIVINPENVNEFIVVMSKPNANTVFHTQDGGQTYTSILGNLITDELSASFRCAEFINTDNGTVYLLGSTVGLFSTTQLDGENTLWESEALETIGICTITDIDFRPEDDMIGVSTHGRGIFMGNASNLILSNDEFTTETDFVSIYPNPVLADGKVTIDFMQTPSSNVNVSIFDLSGKKLKSINFNKNNLSKKHTIDISSFTKGMYILSIKSAEHKKDESFKIIKN
jgi:photosystem II stability/assembly factor-like uncharacterized protein